MSDEWEPGLFGCANQDEFLTKRCCASFLLPHIQVLYQIRAMKDVNKERKITLSDCCCTFFCLHFMVCVNRNEIRNRYNFNRESNDNDCLVSCCCTCCAIHQNSLVIHRNEIGMPGGLFMEDYDTLRSNNQNKNYNDNIINKDNNNEIKKNNVSID